MFLRLLSTNFLPAVGVKSSYLHSFLWVYCKFLYRIFITFVRYVSVILFDGMYRAISLKKKKFIDPRWLFAVGAVISALVTFSEISYFGNSDFEILRNTTASFWHGSIPYGEKGDGLFLYGPLFSIIFTPFALLPASIAPYLWNIFNFCLFFLAIFSLPDYFKTEQKCRFFLFLLPLAAISQLSFRFDTATVYLALFAFSLMERGFFKCGILLVLISAFSGVYGICQIITLAFYPKFLKNLGFAAVVAVIFSASPLLGFSFSDFSAYYQSWFASVWTCEMTQPFFTVFNLKPFFDEIPAWSASARAISFAVLFFLILIRRKRFSFFTFRAGVTGILMGWIVLFGMVSDIDTYLTALAGFMLWYYSKNSIAVIDRFLLWCNFIVLSVIPMDILFAGSVQDFLFYTVTLNVWVFAATWLWMLAYSFFGSKRSFFSQHVHHFPI